MKPHTWDAWELTSINRLPAAKAAQQLNVAIGDVYVARSRVNKMLSEEVKKLQAADEGSP